MRIATRLQRPVLQWGWRLQGAAALVGGVLLLIANPAVTDTAVGDSPLLDWLLPAYLVPGVLALVAVWYPATATPTQLRPVLACYALLAGFVWITVEIRHLFHPGAMAFSNVSVDDAELWAWSAAWLAYGAVLMAAGIRLDNRKLRLTALGVVGLVVGKAFLSTWAVWSVCGACCHSSDWDWH
jgi:uncharacterized membrane protein